MAFYLKYRPKTAAELDNPKVAELISKYLSKPSIPHAFLFTGPKGIGKTSTARIVAKSLNCPKAKTRGVACGVCDVCVSIAKGDSLDVLEIDAASNRGIDEIRDLREKIKLSPTHLTYKVYIIDEVHMLTTEAFNALLKTLEEPPSHAFFILATTEAHKIPETIISRAVRIEFQKATDEEILHSLKRAVKGEGLTLPEEVLIEIAKAAEGSFRDAHKLLEETMVTGATTLESVRAKLGFSEGAHEKKFMELLAKKDAKELLVLVRQLAAEGKNIKTFFVEVLKHLQHLLVAQFDHKSPLTKSDIVNALTLFSAAYNELKSAIIPTLPFELAIIEFCEGEYIPLPPTHGVSHPTSAVKETPTDASAAPLVAKWSEFLETIKKSNTSLVGVLRSCRPLSIQDGVLTLEAAYKFHADRVNDPKVRDTIAKVVHDMLGLTVKVQAVIKKRV